MGNLLGNRDSFNWQDNIRDRNTNIENLTIAIENANEFGDRIFATASFLDFTEFDWWYHFVAFLYETEYDSEARIARYPWLGQLNHTALIYIIRTFVTCTPNNSENLAQLSIEFPNENNQLIAFYNDHIQDGSVYDLETWEDFHRKFVTSFSLLQRRANLQYFHRFFLPMLRMPPNQIQHLINNGQCHHSIIRLDIARVVGEQVHIHFNECALNIDGTWKHHDPNYRINEEVCEKLVEWGFQLPIEYY